jgi:SPOR domain
LAVPNQTSSFAGGYWLTGKCQRPRIVFQLSGARSGASPSSVRIAKKYCLSSFRDLQTKYPKLLGGYTPIIRRADLGAKGIYYRTMIGPFTSADQATELCSNLTAAGVRCLVQKN